MEVVSNVKDLLEHKYLVGAVSIVLLAILVFYRLQQVDTFYPGFPVAGDQKAAYTIKAAKDSYIRNGKDWLLGFAQKRLPGGFQVITDSGPRIFFDHTQANRLKHIEGLTVDAFVKREFYPHLPGLNLGQDTPAFRVVVNSVRYKLTQNLKPVTGVLCKEADLAISDIFGEDTKQFKKLDIFDQPGNLVARLSSRVLVGDYLCRNPAWANLANSFTHVYVVASRQLRLWPTASRDYIHWILPSCIKLRKSKNEARMIVDEELKRREGLGKDYRSNDGVGDLLQWMQELATKGEPVDWAGGQLALTIAAIHTTGDLLIKIIYYLCRYPDDQKAIRDEIIGILQDGGWEKLSLYKMKLLDSFMNEVQRIAAHSISSVNRGAEREIKLDDGTIIPEGAGVSILGDSYSDPNIYPEPEKFDAWRFHKMRSQPGQENHWQFVTASPEHLGFGYGIYSCPGRFFASNELKISLSFLLLRYEWKIENPAETPLWFWWGCVKSPNPAINIMYRRREKDEIESRINALNLL